MQSPPLPENLQRLTSPMFYAVCPICGEGWKELEHRGLRRVHDMVKHGLGSNEEYGNPVQSGNG